MFCTACSAQHVLHSMFCIACSALHVLHSIYDSGEKMILGEISSAGLKACLSCYGSLADM